MKNQRYLIAFAFATVTVCTLPAHASAGGPGKQAVDKAAQNNQFSFVLFYRDNDTSAQEMNNQLKATLANRKDSAIVAVKVDSADDQDLIKQFDATRMPMPAVAVIAPNGAVSGVFPQQVTQQQLKRSIVSPGEAACLKGLQENKIVLLCAKPTSESKIPVGVKQFKTDKSFNNRTTIVSVLASDEKEAGFLQQLQVPTDQNSSVVAFMAPPGVMIGVFNSDVSHATLATKLAEAGRCCEDPNCKHHHR